MLVARVLGTAVRALGVASRHAQATAPATAPLLGQRLAALGRPRGLHVLQQSASALPLAKTTTTTTTRTVLPMLDARVVRRSVTINQRSRGKGVRRRKTRKCKVVELGGAPMRKAVVTRVFTMKPKKPNSAQRKMVKVRVLSTKMACSVYIPGGGHTLQEHSVVMIRGGRRKDLPGCRYQAIRGLGDLLPDPNRRQARSKYGTKKPAAA